IHATTTNWAAPFELRADGRNLIRVGRSWLDFDVARELNIRPKEGFCTIAPSSSCYFAGEELCPSRETADISWSIQPQVCPKLSSVTRSLAFECSSETRDDWDRGCSRDHREGKRPTLCSFKVALNSSSPWGAVAKQRMPADKPFPSNHPHARKQSIQWDQAELEHGSTLHPNTLPLESISESGTPSPSSPSPSFSEATTQSLHLQGSQGTSSQAASRGLGIDFPSSAPAESRKGTKSSSTGTLPIY
ncbi:760_t:CDS:2, partial [Acaulospora colombiana]